MKLVDCTVRFHGAEFQAKDIRALVVEDGISSFSVVEHIHDRDGRLLFTREAEYKVKSEDVEFPEV